MSRRSQLVLTLLGLTVIVTGTAAFRPAPPARLLHRPRLIRREPGRAPRTAALAGTAPRARPLVLSDPLEVPYEYAAPTTEASALLQAPQAELAPAPDLANCRTPRSLMLHGYYGVERMHALAEGIVAAGMHTLTYRDILDGLHRGECPPQNGIVVSLDDLSSTRIDPNLKAMIEAFTDHGLVLVLGVIAGDPQDPQAWAYLQGLESLGIEIASHTLAHPNLPELSLVQIEEQISGSYQVICENLGTCPASLIVPYGSMDYRGRIMQASGEYTFVVGIAGGLSMQGGPPYYVGRAGPSIRSIELTMQVLEVTFGW